MTDRQKGCLPAMNEIMPDSVNRYCARHLYSNFSKSFPGTELRDLFRAASRATNFNWFKHEMDAIKKVDEKAYTYLSNVAPSTWSRHAFDEKVKSDHVTNNLTESFNGWLGEARGKPILSLLEFLRRKLMKRMQKRYEKGVKWTTKVTKKVKKKLCSLSESARYCTVSFVGGCEYEVVEGIKGYIGNLETKTCIYGAWQISGIPCKHAMAAISYKRLDPEDFVDDYFTKETYIKAYTEMIHPVPDQSMWPIVENDLIRPPHLHKRPGRPKKCRRRDPAEPAPENIRRIGTLRCRRCMQFGHNTRTCKASLAPTEQNVDGNGSGNAAQASSNENARASAREANPGEPAAPENRRRPGEPAAPENSEPAAPENRRRPATIKCGRCMQFGHNTRTCKASLAPTRENVGGNGSGNSQASGDGNVQASGSGNKKRRKNGRSPISREANLLASAAQKNKSLL